MLAGGGTLEGRPVPHGQNEGVAVLKAATGPRALTFLDAARVVAVTVADAAAAAPALTGGARRAPPAADAPTKMELRRLIAQERAPGLDALSLALEAELDGLPEDASARLGLVDLARATAEAALRIAKDAQGREALAPFDTLLVAHAEGATLVATRDGAALRIAADCRRAVPDDLAAAVEDAIAGAI